MSEATALPPAPQPRPVVILYSVTSARCVVRKFRATDFQLFDKSDGGFFPGKRDFEKFRDFIENCFRRQFSPGNFISIMGSIP